jgi:hypothetical protein
MEPIYGLPNGGQYAPATAAGTTTSINLSAYIGRKVKILVDASCLVAFSGTPHDGAAGDFVTGASAVNSVVAGTVNPVDGLPYPVVIPDQVDTGALGYIRRVDIRYPYLLLRSRTATLNLVTVKPLTPVLV